MRQLSELAHEYAAMGVLGPIQLIGRRCDEYPLVQDTVSSPLNGHGDLQVGDAPRFFRTVLHLRSSVLKTGSTNLLIFDLEDRRNEFDKFIRRVSEEPL